VTINESLAVALLTNLLKNAFVHNIDGDISGSLSPKTVLLSEIPGVKKSVG
jgi:hypothetical protein